DNIGESSGFNSNVDATRSEIGELMSACAAHIRDADGIEAGAQQAREKCRSFWETLELRNIGELPAALSNRDLLIAQHVYLSAMLDYIRRGGGSRGSYMISSVNTAEMGREIHEKLPFKYIPYIIPCGNDDDDDGNDGISDNLIQEAVLDSSNGDDCGVKITWRERRPIPDAPRWFENVWSEYIKSFFR
ncbi:MAG: hypothetical protein FWC95_05210, partial [Defluviitaleaceae bacterium]|nr:hypothetical protein [Defluviitaleaceae bacterium]